MGGSFGSPVPDAPLTEKCEYCLKFSENIVQVTISANDVHNACRTCLDTKTKRFSFQNRAEYDEFRENNDIVVVRAGHVHRGIQIKAKPLRGSVHSGCFVTHFEGEKVASEYTEALGIKKTMDNPKLEDLPLNFVLVKAFSNNFLNRVQHQIARFQKWKILAYIHMVLAYSIIFSLGQHFYETKFDSLLSAYNSYTYFLLAFFTCCVSYYRSDSAGIFAHLVHFSAVRAFGFTGIVLFFYGSAILMIAPISNLILKSEVFKQVFISKLQHANDYKMFVFHAVMYILVLVGNLLTYDIWIAIFIFMCSMLLHIFTHGQYDTFKLSHLTLICVMIFSVTICIPKSSFSLFYLSLFFAKAFKSSNIEYTQQYVIHWSNSELHICLLNFLHVYRTRKRITQVKTGDFEAEAGQALSIFNRADGDKSISFFKCNRNNINFLSHPDAVTQKVIWAMEPQCLVLCFHNFTIQQLMDIKITNYELQTVNWFARQFFPQTFSSILANAKHKAISSEIHQGRMITTHTIWINEPVSWFMGSKINWYQDLMSNLNCTFHYEGCPEGGQKYRAPGPENVQSLGGDEFDEL